jgi:hypothetical protein
VTGPADIGPADPGLADNDPADTGPAGIGPADIGLTDVHSAALSALFISIHSNHEQSWNKEQISFIT